MAAMATLTPPPSKYDDFIVLKRRRAALPVRGDKDGEEENQNRRGRRFFHVCFSILVMKHQRLVHKTHSPVAMVTSSSFSSEEDLLMVRNTGHAGASMVTFPRVHQERRGPSASGFCQNHL